MSEPRRAGRGGYLAAAVALLLIFAATRRAFLLELPLFIDEATGISRARDSLLGYPFEGLAHAKWLGTFIWSLFRPFGPETLWLVRAVVGLLAALTCASAVGLGQQLHSKGAGLLAGALYLLLPYAVFFDRQALADPLLAACGTVMLVAALRLARRPHAVTTVVTGAALAAAVLSKFSGAVLVPVPLLTALVMAPPGGRKKALIHALLATLLAGAVMLGVFVAADRYLHSYQSILRPAYTWRWFIRHTEVGPDAASTVDRWADVGRKLGDSLPYFIGWPLLVAGVGSLAGLATRKRREVGWLWLVGVLPLIPLLVIVTWLPARYMGFAVMPFAVLGAITVTQLVRYLRGTTLSAPLSKAAGALIVTLLLAWPVPRWLALWAHPANAGLPPFESEGYYGQTFSTEGLADAGRALRVYAAEHGEPVLLVFDGIGYMQVSAYWGGHAGTLRYWQNSPDQQAEVARWLLNGESVAYLDTGGIPDGPHGTQTETLGVFEGAKDTYRLRVVTAPGPDMLLAMYNQAFGNPFGVEGDYRALADQLPGGRTVVLYPPHQVETLAGAVGDQAVELIPLGEGWPLDVAAAETALGEAARSGPVLTVVFFNETAGDPSRAIETWLNRSLFRLSERWVGALRVVDYVTAPGDRAVETPAVTFGEWITLQRARVGTASLDGGQVVTVDLAWRAEAQIERSYKVAAHVMGPDGEVAAQHDGIPMGYLAPTDTWVPGETVIDHFAIAVPPGRYEVRIILYDEATFERLPVTTLEGSPDWVVIGEVVIGG